MENKMTSGLPVALGSSEAVLVRLDTIIRELQDLRRALRTSPPVAPAKTDSLTRRLFGILKPLSQDKPFDVWEEYNAISDWERFA